MGTYPAAVGLGAITGCAFGVDPSESPAHSASSSSALYRHGVTVFPDLTPRGWLSSAAAHATNYFPWMEGTLWSGAFDRLWDIFREIVVRRWAVHHSPTFFHPQTTPHLHPPPPDRIQSNVRLDDFVDRLIDLRGKRDVERDVELKDVSDDLLVAQSVVFFNGGMEAVSNTLSTLSYHLAVNPKVQVRGFFFWVGWGGVGGRATE